VSKIKSPTQKKSLSLKRDRRNIQGENSKSSRKNIAKGKQLRHMDERRAISQVLSRLTGQIDDDVASETELQVKLTITDSRNRGFRKHPDKPLGEVIERKMAKRRRKGILGVEANGTV
jgi:predicted NACHT family NTPase